LFIIFLYQVVKTKERGYTESNPQVSIIGVGYDRTLGGLEMQLRLRDHLARAFNDQKKTPNDVFKNPRSLQKLFKEAGRLKNVLSANTDHVSQVEGLLDDKDFRLPVTREEFEKMCEDLFERVAKPLEMALASAGLSLEHIDQVILVGAGTRVPKVQEKIQAVVKKELGKSLNTDEAAAMGAVYRAADQSPAFKVKKFLVKDAVLYPVQVRRVQRNSENRALIFHIRSGRSRVQRFAHR
jgi:hypoxia up-regulated 1